MMAGLITPPKPRRSWEIKEEIEMTKIELKNIKYAAFASKDSACYEATLYVDGKRFASVSNSGHGGCDMQEPIKPYTHEDLRKLEETIKKEYPKWNSKYGDCEEYDTDLEILCSDLLNEWHLDKDIKKTLKKIAFVQSPDGEEIYMMGTVAQAKNRGDQIRNQILQDYPKAIILNDLPLKEARRYFANA